MFPSGDSSSSQPTGQGASLVGPSPPPLLSRIHPPVVMRNKTPPHTPCSTPSPPPLWFDKYNSCLSIEDKHTPGFLLLWKDPEGHIHDSDLLNLIPCELDITSTPFSDETIITYDIDLLPSGNKVGFNLLNDEDFTIPYITDTIPNFPAGYQITSQANRNVWIIAING